MNSLTSAKDLRGKRLRRVPGHVIGKITLRVHGQEGPEVFLLHGGPGARGSVWDLAEQLSDEFRVHEPLLRLSGSARLTVSRHVADLREIVAAPAIVVGHSWGAMLGLSFAARFPHTVKGLALIGCGTYDPRTRREYNARMRGRLGPSGEMRLATFEEKLRTAPSDEQRNRIFAEIGRLFSRYQAFDELRARPHSAAFMGHDYRGFVDTWADVLRLQRIGREPRSFHAISCPVIMLHGENDPHPGKRIAEVLRQFIPQLDCHMLPRCGHVPWRERIARERFHAVFRKWIRDNSR